MKLNIVLNKDALVTIAKGNQVYYWDFRLVTDENLKLDDKIMASVEFELPAQADCMKPAVAVLNQKIKDLRFELHQQVSEVQEELNDLLSLPAPQEV